MVLEYECQLQVALECFILRKLPVLRWPLRLPIMVDTEYHSHSNINWTIPSVETGSPESYVDYLGRLACLSWRSDQHCREFKDRGRDSTQAIGEKTQIEGHWDDLIWMGSMLVWLHHLMLPATCSPVPHLISLSDVLGYMITFRRQYKDTQFDVSAAQRVEIIDGVIEQSDTCIFIEGLMLYSIGRWTVESVEMYGQKTVPLINFQQLGASALLLAPVLVLVTAARCRWSCIPSCHL
jgi:hypothetical protein